MKIIALKGLAVGLMVGLSVTVAAREIGVSKPERQGYSSERLERITTFMNDKVEDGTMVGGMGLIARNGKVIYQQTYGMADREAERVMEDDAIFRIFSMTKPVTSVALMMLYEEGKFRLSDPIAWYMPEFANLEVAMSTANTSSESDGTQSRTVGEGDQSLVGQTRKPTRQPTIRDILTHTAGFTYGIFGNTEVDKLYMQEQLAWGNRDLQEWSKLLAEMPLQYDPGTRWHYSVSVDLQGRLVEVLSGMKFSEFLKQRLFNPLDMIDTGFVVPADSVSRLAQIYKPAGAVLDPERLTESSFGKGLVPASPEESAQYLYGSKFESGGGGLVSTTRDYLRFCQMLLNGGSLDGKRILSPKTIELMTGNHLGDIELARGRGFGLGFGIVLDPSDMGTIGSAGTYSWGGLAGTRFWIDPVEKMVGIFMVQSVPHTTRLADDFRVLAYQALVE